MSKLTLINLTKIYLDEENPMNKKIVKEDGTLVIDIKALGDLQHQVRCGAKGHKMIPTGNWHSGFNHDGEQIKVYTFKCCNCAVSVGKSMKNLTISEVDILRRLKII